MEIEGLADRKKINPFSSTLSTAPHNKLPTTALAAHPFSPSRAFSGIQAKIEAKEFYPSPDALSGKVEVGKADQ